MKTHRRTFQTTGFSLIELLVVVAILGLLAVTVLPNLSDTSKTELVRQGTGRLSSFVALAQSRALGATTPRGLVFRQLPNSGSVFGGGVVLDLAACEGLEPYSGETYDSRVLAFVPSASLNPQRYYTRDHNGNGQIDTYNEVVGGDRNRNGVLETPESSNPETFWGTPYVNLQFGPTASDFWVNAVSEGDLILFKGASTPFRLRSGGGSLSLTSFVAEIRPELGETLSSVSWPSGSRPYIYPGPWAVASSAFTNGTHEPLRYEILRQPKMNSGISDQLSGEACVDMGWASVGYALLRSDDPATPIGPGVFTVQGNWFRPGLDICVLFNAVGSPSEVIQIPTTGVSSPVVFYRKQLTEPFFLLVGRADRVGEDYVAGLDPDANPDSGCNWQHPDSRWVAIDTNGRVVVAEPAPVSSPNWWEALYQSQQFIRSDLGAAP